MSVLGVVCVLVFFVHLACECLCQIDREQEKDLKQKCFRATVDGTRELSVSLLVCVCVSVCVCVCVWREK